MALSSNLMKAILSMDAYNRGYEAGILFGNNPGNNNYSNDIPGTKLGSFDIVQNSSEIEDTNGNKNIDQNIGFYALAYSYNGETVISYRGTDSFILDPIHGWTLGAGNTDSEQGLMAVDFYNEVADTVTTDISLTGHSLGGGACWVYWIFIWSRGNCF